jgi:hypothetical protein
MNPTPTHDPRPTALFMLVENQSYSNMNPISLDLCAHIVHALNHDKNTPE